MRVLVFTWILYSLSLSLHIYLLVHGRNLNKIEFILWIPGLVQILLSDVNKHCHLGGGGGGTRYMRWCMYVPTISVWFFKFLCLLSFFFLSSLRVGTFLNWSQLKVAFTSVPHKDLFHYPDPIKDKHVFHVPHTWKNTVPAKSMFRRNIVPTKDIH